MWAHREQQPAVLRWYELLHLPLVAALVVFVAAALTRELRSLRVLGAGLAVGFVVGVFPWVLYGDPAGNFGGLLRPA